jgi:hypothetical protein
MYTLEKSYGGETMLQRRLGTAGWVLVYLLFVLGPSRAWSAEPYYIDPATAKASSALPQSIVDRLNQQGWLLYTENNGLKEPICEIFLAKTVAFQAAPHPSSGMKYAALQPGEFVGVVHLLPEATDDYSADFHGQKLKPGYYTLRYSVMPAGTYENGPRLGEFMVLSLASIDHDPASVLKPEALAQLSTSSSSTDLPASMELVAPNKNVQHFPKITMDDAGTCTFHVQLQLRSSDGSPSKQLPVAIVMLTPVPHPEGS